MQQAEAGHTDRTCGFSGRRRGTRRLTNNGMLNVSVSMIMSLSFSMRLKVNAPIIVNMRMSMIASMSNTMRLI